MPGSQRSRASPRSWDGGPGSAPSALSLSTLAPDSPARMLSGHRSLESSGQGHLWSREGSTGTLSGVAQVATVPGSPCRVPPDPLSLPGELERESGALCSALSGGQGRLLALGTEPWRPGFAASNFLSLCGQSVTASTAAQLRPTSPLPPPTLSGRPPTPPQPRAAKHNSVRIVRGAATERIWRRRKSIFDHKVNIISRLTVCRIKKRPI